MTSSCSGRGRMVPPSYVLLIALVSPAHLGPQSRKYLFSDTPRHLGPGVDNEKELQAALHARHTCATRHALRSAQVVSRCRRRGPTPGSVFVTCLSCARDLLWFCPGSVRWQRLSRNVASLWPHRAPRAKGTQRNCARLWVAQRNRATRWRSPSSLAVSSHRTRSNSLDAAQDWRLFVRRDELDDQVALHPDALELLDQSLSWCASLREDVEVPGDGSPL